MSKNTRSAFACPVHKTLLDDLYCAACEHTYPSLNGIPVLINDANSIFRTEDYLAAEHSYGGASAYAGSLDTRTGLRQIYRRMMFRLSESAPPKRDFGVADAVDQILMAMPEAQILVIGSGDTSIKGNVTYSDVAYGKNVACIADAHDLPFVAQSFDACIVVAVLEHVLNPYRCVEEIQRVLRPGAYIFAETPFMQPVHMREYDFTRFTYLGHRHLFRYFDEIRSGIAGGSGVSAAQVLRYALASTSDNATTRKWLKLLGILLTYPLRWLDYISHSKRSAYDSASGFYFFGTLRTTPIASRDFPALFRGA